LECGAAADQAISGGNKRRIVPNLLSFLILPGFRGNLFYVVQRYHLTYAQKLTLSEIVC